jgi:hypothetical protein
MAAGWRTFCRSRMGLAEGLNPLIVRTIVSLIGVPNSVIPAKVLRQAQDRELVERPESSILCRFWTPAAVYPVHSAGPE